MSVLVIGSLIVDNTIYVKSFPQPGETIFAKSSLISHGGKGANQALAVHLSGGEVNLMGCVGGDSVGEEYKRYLQEKGVGSDYLMTSLTNRTGSAFITVDDSGENSIIVNSGSNSDLRANHIDENIDIKNQSSFAPTIQLKNKPWKTQVVPEVTTCYFDDAEEFFSAI